MSCASRFIMLLSTPFPLLLRHHRSSLLRHVRPHSRLCSFQTSLASLSTSSSNRFSLPPTSSQLSFRRRASQRIHTQTSPVQEDHLDFSNSSAHPWPEWSKLIDALCSAGYIGGLSARDNLEFVAYEELSEDFVRASSACLAFARDRPELIRLLSRRDIGVVVENGTPFLFKSALDTARRMRAFLGVGGGNVLESDKAQTVDLMKYLLSYASNPAVSSEKGSLDRGELVESSVRILFDELARLSYGALSSEPSASVQHQILDSYGQTTRPCGRKIEMKRGDWICPRCNFMNFARNIKCLECEEARPKRQLIGGEWECPQCNFYNYGRNLVCLRCDCKRPGEASEDNTKSNIGLGYSIGAYTNKLDLDGRLAANEEKAQRWFTKVSQLDSASDLGNAAADDDFPEIMPLRKGENRFVTSTRKTVLERRLANAPYRRNLGDGGSVERSNFQSKDTGISVTQRLDEILGHASSISSVDNKNATDAQNAGTEGTRLSTSASSQYGHRKESNSNPVPFVPLPDNMFAKKPQNSDSECSETTVTANNESISMKSIDKTGAVSETSGSRESNQEKHDKKNEQAEKAETWFKKVAELHSGDDLSGTVSEEDFPDKMPMRKGENRFVVSKKKDRSLTTPLYKRRMAMEQASNSNFVPFVPFPPDYFAKKDKQQSNVAETTAVVGETSSISTISETSDNGEPGLSSRINQVQRMQNQQTGTGRGNLEASGDNSSGRNTRMDFGRPISENTMQNTSNSKGNNQDGWSSGYSGRERTESRNVMGNSHQQPPGNENIVEGWRGKSLEGSAVEEPDQLDMSEEAKAQRFFRRVAQIKDISELSQIPDEDFPSIMPMRKGVNRFVVSKRKTPLERRLTSPQYRRNLPIVSSDPLKKENDNS